MIKLFIDLIIIRLYYILVHKVLSAQVVRLSLVILDFWQVYALYKNRTVINLLVGPTVPTVLYMTPVWILAIFAMLSLTTLSRKITLIFLGGNIMEFMFFTFAAAVYSSEQVPLFGVGLFAFIALVSIGAFLRVLILEVQSVHSS